MDSIEKYIEDLIDPLNEQVVILKDVGAGKTGAGLFLPESGKAKFKSGIVIAAAPDCTNTSVQPGVRVGYQRHAGADMTIVHGGARHDILVVNEGSLTMILKNDARLDGGE